MFFYKQRCDLCLGPKQVQQQELCREPDVVPAARPPRATEANALQAPARDRQQAKQGGDWEVQAAAAEAQPQSVCWRGPAEAIPGLLKLAAADDDVQPGQQELANADPRVLVR